MIATSEQIAGIGFTSQRTRTRMVCRLMESGIRNERLLQVLNTVPRHMFVDEAIASRAYEDVALPIGVGQTISQPFAVARMSEILIGSLLDKARRRFRSLQYRNINARYSDGSWGWASHGPYDGIIVTAAPRSVPEPLLEQLAMGGRMIVPVGEQSKSQLLTIITRTPAGFEYRQESDVNFVPFLSGKS